MAAKDYEKEVQSLYVAFLNRPADPIGLLNFENALNAAQGSEVIRKVLLQNIGDSTEASTLYQGLNSLQIVNNVYLNCFGRTAEFAGLIFWAQQLDFGSLTLPQMIDAMIKGAQGSDATFFNKKVSAAIDFTNAIDTGAELVAYSGNLACVVGKNYLSNVNLTTTDLSGLIDNSMSNMLSLNNLTTSTSLTTSASPKKIELTETFSTHAPVPLKAAPGFTADALSYQISSDGLLTFSGYLSKSLKPELIAPELALILADAPQTAVAFTSGNDSYLYANGVSDSFVKITGVQVSGVGGSNSTGTGLISLSKYTAPVVDSSNSNTSSDPFWDSMHM